MRRPQERSECPPALVLTVDPGEGEAHAVLDVNALTISRSLGRRGVPVYRFHNNASHIDLQSRYCTHVRCPNLVRAPEAVVQSLLDFANQASLRPVIFPAGDHGAEFLANWRDALEPSLAVCVPSKECMDTILDKPRLYDLAREAGVAAPVTHTPGSLEEMKLVATRAAYPAALRPRSSHHWKRKDVVRAIGSVKAIRAEDPETLIGAYERIAAIVPQVMVQEIVPGPDDLLLTFLGYMDRAGQPLGGCVRKKLRQSPPGFGYCCLTDTVADTEVLESALRLLRRLNCHGIVSVEFKRDPRDGRLKLIEINPRIARTTGVAIAAGVDLPYIAYQDLVGESPSPCLDCEPGVRWIHLIDEALAVFLKYVNCVR